MNRLARSRIDLQSIPDKRAKRFPDILADYQIGNVVLLGRLIVDDHQSGAAVFRHQRKAGGRPDHKGRSDRKKEVAMLGKFGGPTHRVIGHRLAERDGGGLDRFVAHHAIRSAAISFEAPLDPAKIVIPAATDATRIRSIAVKLYDMLGGEPRHLMQI